MTAFAGDPEPPDTPTLLRRTPEQREMVLVAGLAFFLNLFPGTFLQMFHPRLGLVLTQVLFIAAPVALALRWFFLDRRTVLPFLRPRGLVLPASIAGALALNHLLTLYGAWQERVAPTPESIRSLFDDLFVYRGAVDFALLITCYALVPAVCEEMLFRGYLQAGLTRLLERPARGIAATAVIFGLFHLDPWRIVGVVAIGVYLGWIRHATASLLPAMAAHAASNAFSIALSASGRLTIDRAPGSAATAIAAALLLGGAVVLLRRAGSPVLTGSERML